MISRKRLCACLLAAALWLSGCARADGALVSLGDSLARGYGLSETSQRYSSLAAEALDMTEINLGADGQMAMETLEVVRENRTQFEKADMILISIGANHIMPALLQRDVDVELRLISFERELQMLLEAVAEAAPQGQIVILTFACPAQAGDAAQTACDRLNEIIRETAEACGCLAAETAQAIYAYAENVWQADGLHPDETGHRLLAECILDTVWTNTTQE